MATLSVNASTKRKRAGGSLVTRRRATSSATCPTHCWRVLPVEGLLLGAHRRNEAPPCYYWPLVHAPDSELVAVGSWSFLYTPLHQHFIFVPLESSHSDVHGRIVHLWNSDFLLIVQLVADTLCRFHHIGSCRINSHHRCRESLPPYSSPSPLLIIV